MLTGSASTATMILLILAAANLFSYALTSERVPHSIFDYLTRLQLERWQLLLMLMLFFIVAGMFLEVISIILITMPILLPVLTSANIDPIHFAILLVVNMELAVITPPIGLNLFVISAISNVPVIDVFRGTLPFALVLVLFLLALMYMPGAGWLMAVDDCVTVRWADIRFPDRGKMANLMQVPDGFRRSRAARPSNIRRLSMPSRKRLKAAPCRKGHGCRRIANWPDCLG